VTYIICCFLGSNLGIVYRLYEYEYFSTFSLLAESKTLQLETSILIPMSQIGRGELNKNRQ